MSRQACAKILLVDSDALFASVCAARLEHEGFSVQCVTDSAQGMLAINRETPDAILLDMQATEFGGLELLRQLKKEPGLGRIPVLMMAERECSEDAESCFKEGAAEYLAKAHLVPGDTARTIKRALQLN